jgi:uncharacterized tellurite resistance protein B-like protein
LSLLRFLGLDASERRRASEPASLVEIGAQLESLPPDEARFVAAFSYLLARIAGSDLSTDAAERKVMAERLQQFAQVDADRAALLTEAAISASDAYSPSDDHLVARAYAEMSGEEERIRLLRCLYAVAAADETITTVEDNEIFDVAAAIGIRRPDVVAVRAEFKQWLAALRALPTER